MEVKPGCKQSDLGVIPEDWKMESLGRAGRWLSGGTPSMAHDAYWGGDIPWVTAKDMKFARVHDSLIRVAEHAIGNGTRLVPCGSLLMVVRGMILAHTLPVARAECSLAFNQDMKALVPRQGIDSEFLLYWLQANASGILALASEATHGTKRLPSNDLFSVRFPLPDGREQRAIAQALGDVDALLQGLTRLIAKKRDIKQAAMQQLLTGRTRLPGSHGEWEVKPLGDVVETDPENLDGDTHPQLEFSYIALEDVDRGRLRSYSRQVFQSAPSRARRILRPGDVLVSTVRPNLQSHLLFTLRDGIWVCSTGFCVLRSRDGVTNPAFLFAHLFAERLNRQIDALLTGSNYPAINSVDIRALQIPLPSYSEQTAIADVLSDMDAELAALETRRDKTRALKQAMMQELLTGRTRLV